LKSEQAEKEATVWSRRLSLLLLRANAVKYRLEKSWGVLLFVLFLDAQEKDKLSF